MQVGSESQVTDPTRPAARVMRNTHPADRWLDEINVVLPLPVRLCILIALILGAFGIGVIAAVWYQTRV